MRIKAFIKGLYRSFPVQLVLLHFKRFQILLLFWFLLFSTISGRFMHSYGADSLFLAPEYLGEVGPASAAIMGLAIAIYIMSWNITTFILFSRHFRFLATTSNPFLKYCINNALLPLVFLIYYLEKAVSFQHEKELMPVGAVLVSVAGFLLGMVILVAISFLYFFRADRSIIRTLAPVMSNPKLFKEMFRPSEGKMRQSRVIRVEWYLNAHFGLKKTRDVTHYSREFIETIFSRHHFAAVMSIFVAFMFLILLGFWLDSPFFQLPAAAGITIFFAILIAVSGAFSYFLQNWSIPFLLALVILLNVLYENNVIDPSNKAYGLNYTNKNERPGYDPQTLRSLCTDEKVERDKQQMIGILEKWKAKQDSPRPYLYIINTSGGGNRSANFTMNVLQQLDSIAGGTLMDKTFLITGASGGMLGASYYRELSAPGRDLNPQDKKYVDDISLDLLNTIFTSFVARDLVSPAQSFRVGDYEYAKDRGYAFEQKLDRNTRGLMNRQLKDIEEDERNARIPLMLLNSVVTRDGRKMIISTQPVSFLMKPVEYERVGRPANTDAPQRKSDDTAAAGYNAIERKSTGPGAGSSTIDSPAASAAGLDGIDAGAPDIDGVEPDAVDFRALFARQDPMNLRLLTALRMNATFPYVLPNVWLPSRPVIDVMDAGLRDNYGPETTVRFVHVFRDWIEKNTAGVVLIQIRDRVTGGWDHPYESTDITELFTKPLLILQYNWYKMQDYNQNDLLSVMQSLMGNSFQRINFQYVPQEEDAGAALNFHLSKREKKNIYEALASPGNQRCFEQFLHLQQPATEVSAGAAGKPAATH